MGAREIDAEQLWTVIAKQEIHDALMRYSRGIDRCDVELVLSAFHEDALDNHTGVEMRAYDRVPVVVPMSAKTCKWTNHYICNELIEVDGDVARCESYLLGYHRMEQDGKEVDYLLGARYVDRFECRDGVWRIAYRTVVIDWERFDEVRDPPAGLPILGFFDQATRGARAPDDFTTEFFAHP